jgi:hypothetical protein
MSYWSSAHRQERYAALKGGASHVTFMGPPFTFRASSA